MRRMLLFTMLAALPFLIIASPPSKALSGKWFNPYFNQTIKIKKRGSRIKVKGLFHRHRWATFDRIGRRSYQGRNGTVIRMIDRNRILVKNRFHRSRKVFVRHDRRGDYCSRGCSMNHDHNYFDSYGYQDHYGNNYNYHNDHNGSYGNSGYNNYDHQNHGDYDSSYGDSHSFNIKDLDGTYKVRNSGKRIVIINTRDGLKAKYKGSNKRWIKYDRLLMDRSKFVNNSGDEFTVQRDGSLRWKKKRGNKTLRFIKISNDTFG